MNMMLYIIFFKHNNKKRRTKKMKAGKIFNIVFGTTAFILLLLAGLKNTFGWDWNAWFSAVLITLVGLSLVINSGIKNFKSVVRVAERTKLIGIISLIMFGLGLLTLYVGIISFPPLGGFAVPRPSMLLTGWIFIAASLIAIADAFSFLPEKR